jgi:hypothetical protein
MVRWKEVERDFGREILENVEHLTFDGAGRSRDHFLGFTPLRTTTVLC